MQRKSMLIAGIVIVVIVLAGTISAFTVFANNNQKPEYLVAQVYISSWNGNLTQMNPIDVQFRISLDLNNDGTYEVQQYSDVWNNTYIQLAPFRLGGPVASNQGHFDFKIESFKVIDQTQRIPLNYTTDGSIPVNHGSTAENSQDSWHFDATLQNNDEMSCSIDYWYYVS